LTVKTILAYADAISAAPGDTIQFMVSCDGAEEFRADFLRVICGDDGPDGPEYRVEPVETPAAGAYRARKQTIAAGSYVVVPHAAVLDGLAGFSVQAFIQPPTPERGTQIIIAKPSADDRFGFALTIADDGALVLELGVGADAIERHGTGVPLIAGEWAFVAASYDAETGSVRVHQEPLTDRATAQEYAGMSAHRGAVDTAAPLTMAARVIDEGATARRIDHAFNGRIEAPRLANRVLARAEMAEIVDLPISADLREAIVGAWDFSREIQSDRVVDLSGNGLDGTTVNQPARAVKGRGWTSEVHDWKTDPSHYGAIHFHDDDMIDARWAPDVSFVVPDNLRSGFYAARFGTDGDECFVPFFVRPRRGSATAPIVLLASTNTYLAYGNYQFHMADPSAEKQAGALTEFTAADVYLWEHPELGPSLYDRHSDGSPCMYASRLRPVLDAALKTKLWSYNADTHLTDWLEAKGYAYDVVTDEDLHREGMALLAPYRAVLTGAHPEYWTTAMWQAMSGYLDGGGRLMYLGGNGFYWRCAYQPDNPAIVEVRRAETGERYWVAEPGEYYHSFTGEYGGLWRRIGIAPNTLVGIGTVATGYDRSYPYRRTEASFDPRAGFIFEGIGDDESIGDFGVLGGGSAGIEFDAADQALGTPAHALVLARSVGHSAQIRLALEETVFHHQPIDGDESDRVRAELVFFECGDGGAVFSTGSIAWCGSLSHNDYDNNVSRITANVLERFADPTPI